MTFCDRVYKIVKKIPKGKVATYSQVSRLAGNVKAARAVGMCMRTNPFVPVSDPAFSGDDTGCHTPRVPCHRVVGSDGRLVGYSGKGGVSAKKSMLAKEGVLFIKDTVDLVHSQWHSIF